MLMAACRLSRSLRTLSTKKGETAPIDERAEWLLRQRVDLSTVRRARARRFARRGKLYRRHISRSSGLSRATSSGLLTRLGAAAAAAAAVLACAKFCSRGSGLGLRGVVRLELGGGGAIAPALR